MAAQVLVAHTGQRLQIDVSNLSSVDEFKASVSRHTSIPPQCVIALTAQGKPPKLQTIQAEKEIFVYDNRLAQPLSQGSRQAPKLDLPLPKRYAVQDQPNPSEPPKSIQAWQELFKTRRAWSWKIVDDCRQMARETEERYNEMDVMLRCLDAAVTNLESVIKGLEPKYAELKNWLPGAQTEYGILTSRWEQYLSLARSIPASPAMVQFMTGRSVGDPKGRAARQASLEDLVDLETARKAGRLAPSALRKFNNRIADLERVASRLFQDAEDLFREYERTIERSEMAHRGESEQLVNDIEAVAEKIDTDCRTALEYTPNAGNALSQISRVAANHTERLLPSLGKRALEMYDMLDYATKARNSLANESVEFMRSITDITALSHSVKSQINAVNQEDELATFDYLRLIQQVPYMYASFVAEAVKRREWYEKMTQDSSTLANEMALFREEEIKRRRKWYKSIGNTYGPEPQNLDSHVPGLEVNLLGEEEPWPSMTRKDLEDFLGLLQSNKADPEIIGDVSKMISEMNSPTKQQFKRMKAFKNGSIHEAALGRSGLLIRGDDDLLRSLQEDKTKLESKLKTAESRVRRLEDLLHRQSQASRPTLNHLFQAPSQNLSDRADSTFSIKSPHILDGRRGSIEGLETLVQRVHQLEAELGTEKERSAALERDLAEQTNLYNMTKAQVDEANSTKHDLLQNLEALKREFMDERKSLVDEIKRLQARLEDTEDEIEHFGESREHEKASYDETIQALRNEVERLAKEKREEALKLEGKISFLREETRTQRESIEEQERQLRVAQDEARKLSKELAALNEAGEAQQTALEELWTRLSPAEPAPADPPNLVDRLLDKASEVLEMVRRLHGDVSVLRSQLDAAQGAVESVTADKEALAERLSSEQEISARLREALAEERAKVTALESDLADGRDQLDQLRTKLADGETGSESLRKRLQEEETKLAQVTEELASRQTQVGRLEEEVRVLQDKLHRQQNKLSSLSALFDSRSEHARDLSQRLYAQNERLAHLLERLGFSVARQGEGLAIQKIPRSERISQSTSDPDASTSLRRSGTLNGRTALFSNVDLDLLHWVNATDVEAEKEKYDAYMSSLGSFDTDAFCEVVYRRVKDIEHMARKLQRDARAYREKAHAMQKEAHEKIAFKHFKEGDLALFLPTRNQTTGAWAAFNVGFPHYFLREQEHHRLRSREWLVARISRIQERVVDLSKSLQSPSGLAKKGSGADSESVNDDENDNPFDLSDGLRWYLIDAAEDKPGAPSTPGLAKSTVAANNVEAMADRHTPGRAGSKAGGAGGRAGAGIEGVSKTLSKSLESRRSSTGSKKALPFGIGGSKGRESPAASETNSLRAVPTDAQAATSPTQQNPTQGAPPNEPPQAICEPADGVRASNGA